MVRRVGYGLHLWVCAFGWRICRKSAKLNKSDNLNLSPPLAPYCGLVLATATESSVQ